MTEAGWTGNAPTKEGWYWWKRTENDNPVIVWVNAFHTDKQLRAEMISGRRELLTHFTGLFNGPITPDSYQQGRVDSLEKQVEELEMEIKRRVWLSHGSRMKHLLYGDDGKMDCNSCGRDYAAMPLEVAQRYELDDAIKLAQQAQKEKGVGDVHG